MSDKPTRLSRPDEADPRTDLRVILATAPDLATGKIIARALVEEHLVACVNLVPGATSIYLWEGRLEETTEVLLVVKTAESHISRAIERLIALHPYEVPEAIALPVVAGAERYLDWIRSSLR